MNVYDFDNTIYDGESGLAMFAFFLRRQPSLLRFAPAIAKGVIRYKMHKVDIEEAMAAAGAPIRAFLEQATDLRADAKNFWDKYEKNIRPFYYRMHRPDDLIISASPEQSLREICARLGVSRYIGTVLNEETKTMDFVCFRENKVKAFRERYPGQKIDNFYTDSMNDKPLMDISEHVFLVKKGSIEQLK